MARSVGSWDGGTKTVLQPSERPARMPPQRLAEYIHRQENSTSRASRSPNSTSRAPTRVTLRGSPLWSLIHVQRNKFLWCFDNMAGCVELFPSEN